MAADNTVLNPGVGGVTVRTYSDGTLEHPAGVLEFVSGGSANAWTFQVVDATHGLPVAVVGSVAVTGTFFQATQPVSGTVTANAGSGTFTISGAVTNAGTFAVQVSSALPAGTNVIGHVIVDSGAIALSAGVAEIGNVKNSGTFAVQATLSAETTKVIGTVNVAAGQTIGLAAGAAVIGHVIVDAGSAVIGHVIVDSGTITTVSTVTSVTAIANALPAGTNLLGQISASPETSTVYSGTTALTPKFAKISCAASGDNTLVAGVGGKKIRVLSLFLTVVGTTISIYFRENTAGNAIFADGTNPIPLDKTGAAGAAGFSLGYNPVGWMQSLASDPLVLNLSGAQAVAGGLTYVEV